MIACARDHERPVTDQASRPEAQPLSAWRAEWIAHPTVDRNEADTLILPPAAYFRKTFTLPGVSRRGTVHFTALGIVDVRVNGELVTEDRFLPGWTDYNQRVYYLSYDVTDKLRAGKNTVEATLADGWYAGYVGPKELSEPLNRQLYGEQTALRLQLEVTGADGTQHRTVTDSSWQATTGPVRYADLLMGEFYDARLQPEDWTSVETLPDTFVRPQPYIGNPVQVYAELPTRTVRHLGDDTYLFDLGQNFAGYIRLKYRGQRGDTLTFRHGEMLYPDGSLMTENLRFARATDIYVARGEEEEVWEPRFTYHGFRYVEVSGLSSANREMITGVALSASTPRTSTFTSSDTLLRRLYENIIWTQRSNFLEVPTDSPQRDERLGWLGDAQIFSRSALYNTYLLDFYRKWLADVRDAQYDDGPYSVFAPRPYPDLRWYSP
ncbi:MAG: family 78 glycoside hydrolase catalytic domain, partial [Lewinella sp.]